MRRILWLTDDSIMRSLTTRNNISRISRSLTLFLNPISRVLHQTLNTIRYVPEEVQTAQYYLHYSSSSAQTHPDAFPTTYQHCEFLYRLPLLSTHLSWRSKRQNTTTAIRHRRHRFILTLLLCTEQSTTIPRIITSEDVLGCCCCCLVHGSGVDESSGEGYQGGES